MAFPSLLVVDDDPALLRLAEKYLSRLGYSVATCRTAQEALDRCAPDADAYALALIDLSLRDLRGDDLARRLLQGSATIKVVIWSGYPYDLGNLGGGLASRSAFLLKPFSPAMLVATIRQMLDVGC